MPAMTLNEFLGHKPSGGRGKFTKNWKGDKGKGFINVFLHTKAPFLPIWTHPLPQLKTIEDKQTGKVRNEVWMDKAVCWEDDELLASQYFRDKETGERQEPPKRCGICKMTEYVRDCVETGQLGWMDPIFEFKGDQTDPRKPQFKQLLAGGVYGGFTSKKLSEEQIKEMNDHGIYQGGKGANAYQYTIMAKLNYGFAILDADDLKAGITISTEASLLGDKLKIMIQQQMTSKGDEEGNPLLHPYCIRWEAHQKEQNPNDKYQVMPFERIRATPKIMELITSEAPDMSHMIEPFNAKSIRARMEHHCLVDLPWDEFFENAKEQPKVEKRTPEVNTKREVKPAPKEEAATIPCENCNEPMLASATKCENCGQEYEVEGEETEASEPEPEPEPPPPPPPPQPIKRRGTLLQEPSKAKEASPTTPAKKAAGEAPKPPATAKKGLLRPGKREAASPAFDQGDPNDNIPF
jgi:hypothetical protein